MSVGSRFGSGSAGSGAGWRTRRHVVGPVTKVLSGTVVFTWILRDTSGTARPVGELARRQSETGNRAQHAFERRAIPVLASACAALQRRPRREPT